MVKFAYPVRPWRNFKVDATFLDESYYRLFGSWHAGWDINLDTGGDTDYGYPVQSVFPGIVTEVGNYTGWGINVKVQAPEWIRQYVEDRLGQKLDALHANYCHLLHSTVEVGDVVDAGTALGGIGKGDRNQYPAHLHFELRAIDIPANQPQERTEAGKELARKRYIDPAEWFTNLNHTDSSNILPQRQLVQPTPTLNLNGQEVETDIAVVNYVGNRLWVRSQRN